MIAVGPRIVGLALVDGLEDGLFRCARENPPPDRQRAQRPRPVIAAHAAPMVDGPRRDDACRGPNEEDSPIVAAGVNVEASYAEWACSVSMRGSTRLRCDQPGAPRGRKRPRGRSARVSVNRDISSMPVAAGSKSRPGRARPAMPRAGMSQRVQSAPSAPWPLRRHWSRDSVFFLVQLQCRPSKSPLEVPRGGDRVWRHVAQSRRRPAAIAVGTPGKRTLDQLPREDHDVAARLQRPLGLEAFSWPPAADSTLARVRVAGVRVPLPPDGRGVAAEDA